jgi:PAS domain S-box-containing protein
LSHIFLESFDIYKDFFDHAHDLIHIVEPDGKLIYVNEAWKRVLGYQQEEVRGKSINSFIDPVDRDRFIAYRENVLKGFTPKKEIIVALISKDGSKVFIEGFVSAKVVDGKSLYTKGIFRDITAKLQNEAELKEREANLQQLLNYAPDSIIVIDAQSQITFWNPKAEAVFGWSSEEVIGKSLSNIIIPHQYREAHDQGMKRYLTTGEVRVLNKTIEITALNKEGKEFYVSLTISKTFQKGKVAFIAFVRDIDEQKRNALELEQKKVQLEASNQELEQFAHVASHDMKEPIRKVRIFIEHLKNDSSSILSPKGKTYLDKVQNAASRLTKMVDGVLSYSAVKSEELNLENVDLNEIIKNVLDDLELIIAEKKATIHFDTLPVLEGAGFILYQLFYNLINNGLKFSKSDVPPIIKIAAKELPEQKIISSSLDKSLSYVEITVEDNGIGFSQKDAEMIFKTFTRLHSKDQFEGTGLGLSLCKNIVDKHHGIIKAEGKEGEGAKFIIILPVKQ